MNCVLRVALRNDACRIWAFVGVTTTPEVAEVYRRMTLYATLGAGGSLRWGDEQVDPASRNLSA